MLVSINLEHLYTSPYHASMVVSTTGRMIGLWWTAAFLAGAMLAASPALAQDTYKLGPDDAWQKSGDIDTSTAEGQLQEARKALAGKDYSRAENLATRWIEKHEQHPLLPDAYLIRGDAKVGLGDEYQALFDYEFVARSFTGSDAFVTACQREFDIALQYAHGLKRKFLGM